MARLGLVLSCCWLLFAAAASANELNARSGLPLTPGNYWDYEVDGSTLVRLTVFQFPGFVNRVETWIVNGPSGDEHFTNDASGLRLHRTDVDVGGISASAIFDPPLVVLSPLACVGGATQTQGTLRLDISGPVPGIDLPFEATSRPLRVENVTVPAGSFPAVVVETSFTSSGVLSGPGGSVQVSFDGSDQNWFVHDVGIVKSVEQLDFEVDQSSEMVRTENELVDFFVVVPEPGGWALRGVALVMLAGLASRPRP